MNTRSPTASRPQLGFTLIEIMVVITLIGLIATIVVPGVMNRLEEGRVKTTEAKISTLRGVLDTYRLHHSRYPDTLTEMMEPNDKNMGDPYITDPAQLRDAWDREFSYIKSSSRKFELISLGADGLEGGEGPDGDLSSDKSKLVGN